MPSSPSPSFEVIGDDLPDSAINLLAEFLLSVADESPTLSTAPEADSDNTTGN